MSRKLTVKESAARAGVSAALVYKWCEERRLAHYRMGGRDRRGKILIDPADLDDFVAACRVGESPDDGVYTHLR